MRLAAIFSREWEASSPESMWKSLEVKKCISLVCKEDLRQLLSREMILLKEWRDRDLKGKVYKLAIGNYIWLKKKDCKKKLIKIKELISWKVCLKTVVNGSLSSNKIIKIKYLRISSHSTKDLMLKLPFHQKRRKQRDWRKKKLAAKRKRKRRKKRRKRKERKAKEEMTTAPLRSSRLVPQKSFKNLMSITMTTTKVGSTEMKLTTTSNSTTSS